GGKTSHHRAWGQKSSARSPILAIGCTERECPCHGIAPTGGSLSEIGRRIWPAGGSRAVRALPGRDGAAVFGLGRGLPHQPVSVFDSRGWRRRIHTQRFSLYPHRL